MAEFYGIFPNINNAFRRGGWDGWQGGAEWGGIGQGGWSRWQNPHLQYPISSHDTHTIANVTPVGHRVSWSKLRSLPPNWHPPLFQS